MTEDKESDDVIEPSTLDEQTQLEMLMMYEEAANSIRFTKIQKWIVVAIGVAVLFATLAIGVAFQDWMLIVRTLIVGVILTTTIFVYILILYQVTQNTERSKLVMISRHMSSLFRDVRALTSPQEAAFYRYTQLVFMIGILIAACAMVVILLQRFLT